MEILIVEDNQIASRILEKKITAIGHNVDKAENGYEALKLFKKGYDLIILDLNLPDITGFEVLSLIREHEDFRHIILALTVDMSFNTENKCYRQGFNHVYYKSQIFINRIEDLLNKWCIFSKRKLSA